MVKEWLTVNDKGLEDGIMVAQNATNTETFTLFYGNSPFLSNYYYPSPFAVDGIRFNCSEQYYHYKKAGG
jgi:predicted NAD-dependent protein-ADP-ribosyltransferase YbiA (DUF1768 family)